MDGFRSAPARLSIDDRDRFRAAAPRTQRTLPAKQRVPASVGELAKAVVALEAPRAMPAAPVASVAGTTAKTPVPARYMPPMDMDLPGSESPLRHLDSLLSRGKLAGARRWAFRGAVGVVVLVLVAGGFLFWQGFFNLNKSFGNPAAFKKSDDGLLKGEADGRINILLLGRGGGNHDGPDLTDTMMIDSIDVVNHTSTLISIPRDLWVDIPNQGTMKINSAFESGEFKYLGKEAPGTTNRNAIQAGFDEADQTVESVLGITIHYNALVSFQAFSQAVNTVGGVKVNVPTDLVDPTMAWENGHNPVLAKAGKDEFNGKQALNYVRSRETTSDFARAQRQRAVMVALKNKIITVGTLSNPWKIAGLAKTFGNNVQSDLSLSNVKRLYGIVKKVPDNKTVSLGLSDGANHYVTTGTLAGQSIALPAAGLFNYKDIQGYIRTQLKDPYLLKENASIAILNGTPVEGLAGTKEKQLKPYGYNISTVGNAPNTNYVQTQIIDLSHGKNQHTRHSLEQRFGLSATNGLPDNTIKTSGADFVIILGSDEAAPTQN
jgi:LCP family protein required for cell wall assembly